MSTGTPGTPGTPEDGAPARTPRTTNPPPGTGNHGKEKTP